MGEGSVASPARVLCYAGLCFAASLLAGCNETTGSINREPIRAAASAPARNPNISPRGAAVALNLTGVENVPRAIAARFSEALLRAAETREIDVGDAKRAKYYVQLHLTVYPAGKDAVALAYVSDVFDAKKNRAQRLGDDIVLKGSAADPWSLVDDEALKAIASRSADDLAAFLSNTPEAVAAAAVTQPTEALGRVRVPAQVTNSPGMPAGALGFSPVR